MVDVRLLRSSLAGAMPEGIAVEHLLDPSLIIVGDLQTKARCLARADLDVPRLFGWDPSMPPDAPSLTRSG
jgi:hypothetical protein